MLNHIKSVSYGFLCSLNFLVLCSSASWLQWALFSGLPFLGAGNLESCLNQFSGKREVRPVGLI
ncbi:TPA: hypothetical protein ACGUWU_004407, partial [Vibrio vulnificus]